jgi:hypothetical protein
LKKMPKSQGFGSGGPSGADTLVDEGKEAVNLSLNAYLT